MADVSTSRWANSGLPPLTAGALDALSASVAILDPTGKIVAANAAWRRFADENGGRDPGYFIGWNYLDQCDRVPPAAPEAPLALAAAQGLRQVLLAGATFEQEYPCHGPGRERWMRLGARAIPDPCERFFAVVHEDVTARVLAERARDQQLALLRAMFDAALDAIVTIDEHGTIEAANPAAGRMFGYAIERLLGRNVMMLLSAPDRSRLGGLLADCLQSGSIAATGVEREIVGLRRDGTHVPLLLRVTEAYVGDRRVFMSVLHDLSERKAAEAERLERERRELVVRELGHRIGNIFAVVSSVSQMLARSAGSIAEYRDALTDRLCSLAATQSLLTEGGRHGVMLDELIAFELAAYGTQRRDIAIAGDPVRLCARAGQLVGMVIHELATNAAKYGALSSSHGRLAVRWRCAGSGASRRLDLAWIERGGPPVAPPKQKGFGTMLIERSIRYGMAGEVSFDYVPEGLTCRLCLPLDKVTPGRA